MQRNQDHRCTLTVGVLSHWSSLSVEAPEVRHSSPSPSRMSSRVLFGSSSLILYIAHPYNKRNTNIRVVRIETKRMLLCCTSATRSTPLHSSHAHWVWRPMRPGTIHVKGIFNNRSLKIWYHGGRFGIRAVGNSRSGTCAEEWSSNGS